MLNIENTIKITTIVLSLPTMHILSKDVIVQSYDGIQHVVIVGFNLI